MQNFRRLVVCLGWLLLGAAAAHAQLTVTSISINPQQPIDGDMVVFTVNVAAPGSCFTDPTQQMFGQMAGADVPLVLPACADEGLPNDTNFTFQAMVGQFQSDGTYLAQVFRNSDFPGGTPVGTQSVIVSTPGGDTIGGGGNGNGQGLCGADPCFKASTNACPPVASPEPCNLILDLTNAVNGVATTSNWKLSLDTNMTSWTFRADTGIGSQNKPVMSAAIALWVSPTGSNPSVIDPTTNRAFNAYQWWSTFLGCQTGSSFCPGAASNTSQQYFNGAEILSNTYGGYVTLSVAAVALWAQKHPTQDTLGVGAAAHHYLQITVGLWALGAGPTWANSLTYVHSAGAAATSESCEGSSFHMPFLALAGARSIIDHSCDDDRAPIFASAVGFAVTGQCQEPTWNNRLREAIQCAWVPDQYGDNVYGVTPSVGQHLQGFIGVPAYQSITPEGDYATASSIVGVLKGARFIDEYHILSWPGVRASVLYTNPNVNTSPTYAMSFQTNGQAAAGLWPWEQDRVNITPGYCKLQGSINNPTGAIASDCDSKGKECPSNTAANPPQTQSFNFRPLTQTSPYFYQIVLTPTLDAAFK